MLLSVHMISHMCARVGVLVCWRTDVFNHRNQSLRKWLVEEHMLGKMGLAHPAVNGYLIDDWYTKYVNSKRGPSPSAVTGLRCVTQQAKKPLLNGWSEPKRFAGWLVFYLYLFYEFHCFLFPSFGE